MRSPLVASPLFDSARIKWSWYALILILPGVLFWWMLPFASALTIGQDYGVYSIYNQLELQYALSQGQFPLFVPSYAGGVSASALTLGQFFHPQTYLSAWAPGYWAGYALEWNTVWRLISLGFAHLVVFIMLKRLALASVWAFSISLATVYNLRMLDLFRYGASLEAYTAMLFVCASLVYTYVTPHRRRSLLYIAGSTYLLMVSGHPQMTYYGMLTAGVSVLLIPFLLPHIVSAASVHSTRTFWLKASGGIALGIGLSAVYTVPFVVEFLGAGGDRIGQDYTWSLLYTDTPARVFSQWIWPFAGDVHSAFGGSFLPLIALMGALPLLRGQRPPHVVFVLLGLIILILLYSLGAATPIHHFFWSVLPFQSSIRVPGRATMLLPVLCMWLLIWLFRLRMHQSSAPPTLPRWGIAALLSMLLLLVGLPLSQAIASASFSMQDLRAIPSWARHIWWIAGFVSLSALTVIAYRDKSLTPVASGLFIAGWIIQIAVILLFGTWVTPHKTTLTFDEWEAAKQHRLTYPAAYGAGMYAGSTEQHLRHTFREPTGARLYPMGAVVADSAEAYQHLRTERKPHQVLLEPQAADAVAQLTQHPFEAGRAGITAHHISFNRLSFNVYAEQAAFLVMPYAYSNQWHAQCDSISVPVYRANGHELAVFVPTGIHRITLRYSSWAAHAGMLLSLLSCFSLLLSILPWQRPPRKQLVILAFSALLLLLIVYFTWTRWLYTGQSLPTQLTWIAPPPATEHNLAFGRSTRQSGYLSDENYHLYHSSRAVDGDTQTAFATAISQEGWWSVDLGNTSTIETIALHAAPATPWPPTLYLELHDADDGLVDRFQVLTSSAQETLRFHLPTLVDAAYIRISLPPMPQPIFLTLAEVQVYGPKSPSDRNSSP